MCKKVQQSGSREYVTAVFIAARNNNNKNDRLIPFLSICLLPLYSLCVCLFLFIYVWFGMLLLLLLWLKLHRNKQHIFV